MLVADISCCVLGFEPFVPVCEEIRLHMCYWEHLQCKCLANPYLSTGTELLLGCFAFIDK